MDSLQEAFKIGTTLGLQIFAMVSKMDIPMESKINLMLGITNYMLGEYQKIVDDIIKNETL